MKGTQIVSFQSYIPEHKLSSREGEIQPWQPILIKSKSGANSIQANLKTKIAFRRCSHLLNYLFHPINASNSCATHLVEGPRLTFSSWEVLLLGGIVQELLLFMNVLAGQRRRPPTREKEADSGRGNTLYLQFFSLLPIFFDPGKFFSMLFEQQGSTSTPSTAI